MKYFVLKKNIEKDIVIVIVVIVVIITVESVRNKHKF